MAIFSICFQFNKSIDGIKIGILKEGFDEVNVEVADVVKKAIETLKRKGVHVQDISVPMHKEGWIIRLLIKLMKKHSYKYYLQPTVIA